VVINGDLMLAWDSRIRLRAHAMQSLWIEEDSDRPGLSTRNPEPDRSLIRT
jgi:hypothetical protein